jgi:chloride channel protein, CIC family
VRWARVPDGQTVPDVQLAVAKRGGVVPFRPVIIRTLAAVVTLAGGGSAGSEGPTAVLGSSIGSAVGRALRFQPRRLKILVGCGAAAGISAAFNAPFAGAFFALEEVLGSFSIGAFSPVVIASVVAAITVRPFLGSHPAFHIPPYGSIRPLASCFCIRCSASSAGWRPRCTRECSSPPRISFSA